MGSAEKPHTGESAERAVTQDAASRASDHLRWGRLVLFLLIVFGAPALLFRFDRQASFDQASLDALNRIEPEFVFLGNSLLDTRIDADLLTQLLEGRQSVSLAVEGSQSATWYLQLKNLVAPADSEPETVFVFFHKDLLTRPLEGIDGRNREVIESLRREGETEYDKVLDSSRSAHQRTVAALERVPPLGTHGGSARDGLSEVAAALFPSSRSELSDRADDAFAFHNRREPAIEDDPAEAVRPFDEAVTTSFLPPMIEIAEREGIELVFVRVQFRPGNDGVVRESESMRLYVRNLANYLESKGVEFVDFTGNPAVDAALYYDSFHIRQRYLADYTELFFREMAEFFEPGEVAEGAGARP